MENMRRKMGSNWGWTAMRKNWAWGGKQRTKNGFKLGMNSYENKLGMIRKKEDQKGVQTGDDYNHKSIVPCFLLFFGAGFLELAGAVLGCCSSSSNRGGDLQSCCWLVSSTSKYRISVCSSIIIIIINSMVTTSFWHKIDQHPTSSSSSSWWSAAAAVALWWCELMHATQNQKTRNGC